MTERFPVVKKFNKPSRTRQSFADESNINKIMAKWRTTGIVPNLNVATPVYEDFSNSVEYMDALNAIASAQAVFANLPSKIRKHVDNDPAKFIAWAEDPANLDELKEFGLVAPEAEVLPPVAVVITNGGNPPAGEESDPA